MKANSKKQNILVIRSASLTLNRTLQLLKQEFPDSNITVLAPISARENTAQNPLIDEVLTIGNHRRMGVFSYGIKNLLRLRKRNFDLAVALYNVDHGLGYSNIDFLACASNASNVRGYNKRQTFVKLNGLSVLKKFMLEKTSLLWVILNLLATGILFLSITLGLTGEWCVRKFMVREKIPEKDPPTPELEPLPESFPAGATQV